MKCPNCQADLPSRECPECHKSIPKAGKFCAYCGEEVEPHESSSRSDEEGLDFSKRVLCSDGTCIGVINEQGVCSECGKPPEDEGE